MTTLGEGLASRPVRRAARSLFSAALLMIAPARGDAQVFQLEAGSSTLFTANGGTVEARTADARMLVSAGRLHNDFVIGSLFQKKVRGVTTSIGDGLVNFDLPSDLFGGGHYLPLRGARVDRDRSDSHLSAFGGFTSTSLGAPFFRGGTWGQPLGMLSADRTVSPRWRIFPETHSQHARPPSKARNGFRVNP